MRYLVGSFIITVIALLCGSLAYGGVLVWQEQQRTTQTRNHLEAATIEQEIAQLEADSARTLAQLEVENLQLREQLTMTLADLEIAQAAANAIRLETDLLDFLVREQAAHIRREEAQEDRRAFLDRLFDRGMVALLVACTCVWGTALAVKK